MVKTKRTCANFLLVYDKVASLVFVSPYTVLQHCVRIFYCLFISLLLLLTSCEV